MAARDLNQKKFKLYIDIGSRLTTLVCIEATTATNKRLKIIIMKNEIAKAIHTNPQTGKTMEVFAYTNTEVKGGMFVAARDRFEASIKVSKVLLSGCTWTVAMGNLKFVEWVK